MKGISMAIINMTQIVMMIIAMMSGSLLQRQDQTG
jgi:hypothetical protein